MADATNKSNWTKDDIVDLLKRSDAAVERGIVAIYELQTEDEKCDEHTKHSNGVGFGAFDAKTGTYMAQWIKSGKHLTGAWMGKARKMAMKYAGQLAMLANEKAEAQAAAEKAEVMAAVGMTA